MSFTVGFSQTEFDYYEKQRAERQSKKIKTIFYFDEYDKENPYSIYRYDTNGYIIKIEYFVGRVKNKDYKLWKEINVVSIDEKGNLSGYEYEYDIKTKNSFNKSPSEFWEIGFGENLVERVEYIFDKSGKVKERRSYGDHAYPKEFSVEKFSYKDDILVEILDVDSQQETYFFYNENGLLIKISSGQSEDSTYLKYDFYE